MSLYDVVNAAAHDLKDAGCGPKLVAEYLREIQDKPSGEARRITEEWLRLFAPRR